MSQLTVQAWADSVGISRQAAYKAIERCGIPVADGRLDADVAGVLYRKRTRARANERRSAAGAGPGAAPHDGTGQHHGEPENPDDYWASRARREKAEAELAELKLAEQRGELVRAADVRSALARKTAALREGFLQLPARVVPLLVAEPDAARMDQVLRGEIHAVLAQLTEV